MIRRLRVAPARRTISPARPNPEHTAERRGAASTSTPVSDAVLANPLAIPPGVAQWLRQWELLLRAALRAAEAPRVPQPPVPAWEEALAELRGLDPDAPESVFRLLLLRPLWQLEEGSPARDTFERYVRTVLDRIDAARALAQEIVPLREERDRLIADFAPRFPNRLAEQLERVRARDVDIARLRRASDARRMRARLARGRAALERLASLVPPDDDDSAVHARVDGETETIAEMTAALALAEQERRQLVLHPVALRAHRRHLVAQLRGLARSAPPGARAADAEPRARTGGHTAVVLEQLIHAAGAMDATPTRGRDAPVWTGAISAGLAAHHPGLDRFAWLPALLAADDASVDDDPTLAVAPDLLHVVPVGDGLVHLSPQPSSAVRVYTRTVRLGESVECQVVPDLVPRHSAALLDADVAALFDGLDPDRSRWYSTASRARARVVARHGGGWFARLEQRGQLTVLEQPAWHRDGPGAAFRLLRPAAWHNRLESVVPSRDEPVASFLGFTTRECRTGLRDDERAWVRGLVSGWNGASEAIAREAELFSRLESQSADRTAASLELALRPLTWVRVEKERDRYPLYAVPLATVDAPRRLRSWIVESDDHLLAVVASVARILQAAHAAGFALGVCHAEAFAYTLAWSRHPLTPRPAAVLAHAPCATRLGEPFAPPGGTGLAPAYYRMLRTPVLVPQVAAAQPATIERDMQGFGAFVLDLLLEHPIYERGTLDWYDAPAVVRARASQCSPHPTIAKYLADSIQEPPGWRRLTSMLERLAAGKVEKVAELM